ncbi:MAG TPA: GNAT family N-acetyltransferase [Pyrinomonadaceae bacterium]|nr:GNAT family N-acetyltransferase [Pyrinomonadaceae bacterium]
MPQSIRAREAAAATKTPICAAPAAPKALSLPEIQPLDATHRDELLAFLAAARSADTVFMSGLVRDNGVTSEFNRGHFYGCRDRAGRLEGVALIGHATLVEARTQGALASFARLARQARAHVIVGEQEKVEQFWAHYEQGGQQPLRICRELFLEQRWPLETLSEAAPLHLATAGDLEQLISINAAMACDESGVNPLDVDPEGFRARLVRRIEAGRVWVWKEEGRLIFKVDVMAEVPGCTYLEGVYVNPSERRRGYGRRAMTQLARLLLARTEILCLLVNEQNKDAQAFFFKAGYKLRACYDTIFLQPKMDEGN